MPRFNPRTRIFMTPVRSKFRSYFKPECQPKDDAKMGDQRPPFPYDPNLDQSPEEENEYYNKPRPYYPSKHLTFSIETLESYNTVRWKT